MATTRSAKERDRLLRQAARGIGLVADATALALVFVPGALVPDAIPLVLTALFALVGLHLGVGRSDHRGWLAASGALSLALGLFLGLAGADPRSYSGLAIVATVNTGASAVAAVLVTEPRRILPVVPLAAIGVLPTLLVVPSERLPVFVLISALPWVALVLLGLWLSAAVPRVVRRIDSIGQAHRVERQASETEAQRRQSARLLHDTVLATLTLLAHSGVGVSADALRQQAADDARLLRQLRLGATPTPAASGSYQLTTVASVPVNRTLETVKSRFGSMGLDVNWHGSGQVALEGPMLDSFLLALAECLENVRRHSGVRSADVTITEDERTVRAMVTDAGSGFDITTVPSGKLGFKESVVARLTDVGGNARLFSAPGAGTTVVLEVPR